jgi:2OG-Fe(II) oxygenase superfamily
MDQKSLKNISLKTAEKISSAKIGQNFFEKPYKHLVIDNFLEYDLAQKCLTNFPNLDDPCWEFANEEDIEIKYRTTWDSEFDIPEGIVDAVRILNGADFLRSISNLFEIDKLIPDPYFSGGGLNVTRKGGLLDVHVDGNYHDASGLNRRMNALIYLNPSWQQEWGGEFGVYDEAGENCVKKIEPLFNRLVVFESHDKSWHGLPEPVNFPEDAPRKSILLYYYTKEPRPDAQVLIKEPHSALWKKKGFLDKRGNKTREYF